MKKKVIALSAFVMACTTMFVACGGGGNDSVGGGNGNTITAKPLTVSELGEGFKEA